MANTNPKPQSIPQWVDARRIVESASEDMQSECTRSTQPTLQSQPRTSRLGHIQTLLAFLRQRPALIAVLLWIALLDIAFVATLVLITPQFAERQESLPSSRPTLPSSERVADQSSTPEKRALPMLSLVSIALGCSLGSLMIAQRLRPPQRLTRSPSRLTARKSFNPRGSTSSSSSKAEPSLTFESELPSDAAAPSASFSPSPDGSHIRRRPTLPPKLEANAAELTNGGDDRPRIHGSEAISLDELDIRRRRSPSSWDESGLGTE